VGAPEALPGMAFGVPGVLSEVLPGASERRTADPAAGAGGRAGPAGPVAARGAAGAPSVVSSSVGDAGTHQRGGRTWEPAPLGSGPRSARRMSTGREVDAANR